MKKDKVLRGVIVLAMIVLAISLATYVYATSGGEQNVKTPPESKIANVDPEIPRGVYQKDNCDWLYWYNTDILKRNSQEISGEGLIVPKKEDIPEQDYEAYTDGYKEGLRGCPCHRPDKGFAVPDKELMKDPDYYKKDFLEKHPNLSAADRITWCWKYNKEVQGENLIKSEESENESSSMHKGLTFEEYCEYIREFNKKLGRDPMECPEKGFIIP